jgi:hypothetical protein
MGQVRHEVHVEHRRLLNGDAVNEGFVEDRHQHHAIIAERHCDGRHVSPGLAERPPLNVCSEPKGGSPHRAKIFLMSAGLPAATERLRAASHVTH